MKASCDKGSAARGKLLSSSLALGATIGHREARAQDSVISPSEWCGCDPVVRRSGRNWRWRGRGERKFTCAGEDNCTKLNVARSVHARRAPRSLPACLPFDRRNARVDLFTGRQELVAKSSIDGSRGIGLLSHKDWAVRSARGLRRVRHCLLTQRSLISRRLSPACKGRGRSRKAR